MKSRTLDLCLEIARGLLPRGSVSHALRRPAAAILHKVEGAKARFSPLRISDQQLLKSLGQVPSVGVALECFRRARPPFFIDPSGRRELASLIQKDFQQLRRETVGEADRALAHVFDLLGSGPVNLDEFVERHGGREECGYIPWHFDFKTGYMWNQRRFYREVEIPYGKADIKVPWELSRFQHAAVLGQAYWLTGDEKYAQEFVRQVDDWIDRNPPKFGVNWTCTMDVAIRVANWILGFYFFKDSPTFTDEFLVKFLKSLLAHGRHIMANLENKGNTNNHYLADLVGLIYLGIAFPEFKEARRWREFGVQELVKEMDKQVYDDGMDFEASTCYHRLALELLFYPALLCRLNGIELPVGFVGKLEKMFGFVLYLLKPNGRMPQIGDNDNGRLHVPGKRDSLDMTYLLTFATLYFDDPSYKVEEFGFAPEALWFFGPEAYDRWNGMPGRSVQGIGSKAFPDAGVFVMRNGIDFMVISCGPDGQGGIGGHSHNDKLSFELCIDGEDIIIDPGTYTYTADPRLRNRFRSTGYHNTIMVADEEQSHISETELFVLHPCAVGSPETFVTTPERDFLEAEHTGYRRLRPPVSHRRKINYEKTERRWSIADTMQGGGQWSIATCFHLAPNLAPRATAPNRFVVATRKGCYVEFVIRPATGATAHWEMTEGWISPSYGKKCRSTVAQYRVLGVLPVEFSVMISHIDHVAREDANR